jgi:hypothetical protein
VWVQRHAGTNQKTDQNSKKWAMGKKNKKPVQRGEIRNDHGPIFRAVL